MTTVQTLIQNYFDAQNRRDLAALTQLWSPLGHYKINQVLLQGRDEILAGFSEFWQAEPDFRCEIQSIHPFTNGAAVQWIGRGPKRTTPDPSQTPLYEIPTASILLLTQNTLTSQHDYFDPHPML